jgi:hypothetical protein
MRTGIKYDAFTLCARTRLLTLAAQYEAVTEPRSSGSGCAIIYDAMISLMLIGCCAVTASARQEYKRDFQKTAPLAAGRSLRVEHSMGSVNVRVHAGNEVAVQAAIRCSADAAEEAKNSADQTRSRAAAEFHPHRIPEAVELPAQPLVFGRAGNSDAGVIAARTAQPLRRSHGTGIARGIIDQQQ